VVDITQHNITHNVTSYCNAGSGLGVSSKNSCKSPKTHPIYVKEVYIMRRFGQRHTQMIRYAHKKKNLWADLNVQSPIRPNEMVRNFAAVWELF
jgi:hypothetical protein